MSPVKPLNPSAKEFQPAAESSLQTNISLYHSPKQLSFHPFGIFAQNKCINSFFYYASTPSTQLFYYQTFPFKSDQNDEIFLKEGEKVIKKVLKIDHHHHQQQKIDMASPNLDRCLMNQVPPRLKRRSNNNNKKIVSQKWRARTVKSDINRVNTFPSPPPAPAYWKKNTTVMIKNIPNQYRKKSLMEFLDPYCLEHKLEYDFFYLPMDFRSHDNLGFAFVNFTTAAAALKAKEVLQGFKWGVFQTTVGVAHTSRKICDLTWARIQGKDALLEHFEKSCFVCKNKDYLPVVLLPPRNGVNGLSVKMSIVGRLLGQF